MSTRIVFAASTSVLRWGAGSITVRRGDPWDADDPLVKRYPTSFVDDPSFIHRTTVCVEQATAAPGEVRQVKRGK
jgi:hypothetical protein